jgi:hypothetical protein
MKRGLVGALVAVVIVGTAVFAMAGPDGSGAFIQRVQAYGRGWGYGPGMGRGYGMGPGGMGMMGGYGLGGKMGWGAGQGRAWFTGPGQPDSQSPRTARPRSCKATWPAWEIRICGSAPSQRRERTLRRRL